MFIKHYYTITLLKRLQKFKTITVKKRGNLKKKQARFSITQNATLFFSHKQFLILFKKEILTIVKIDCISREKVQNKKKRSFRILMSNLSNHFEQLSFILFFMLKSRKCQYKIV